MPTKSKVRISPEGMRRILAASNAASRAKQVTKTVKESKEPKPSKNTFVMPKTLAGCADKLYEVREERLAKGREEDALKKTEGLLRNHLIDALPKGEASGIAGKLAFAHIEPGTAFSGKDWGKIYAQIVKEYLAAKTPEGKLAAFRYLNRALTKEPLEEIWDNGKTFPGVERIPVKKVLVSKRKGK